MSLILITPPVKAVVTVDEAKLGMRVTENDQDPYIEQLIMAARSRVDGGEGILGRALITQRWELGLDCFPYGDEPILLLLAPVISITSIKYIDDAGTEQTWPSTDYQVDVASQPGRVVPAYGKVYPSTRRILNAVKVRFDCGYGTDATAVPELLRLAIRALVAHWYESREPVVVGQVVSEVPTHIDAMLAPFKLYVPGRSF